MPRLYAAGTNAVAVVEDGSARTALEGRGAQSLAVDPKDPDTLYVGTSDEAERTLLGHTAELTPHLAQTL